jgi:hypothetical protein
VAADALVGSVETPPSQTRSASTTEVGTLPVRAASRSAQSVSTVNFIQAYSPFMWGLTNVGGLNVDLTLESSSGATKGVAQQVATRTPPNNYVRIDRLRLYYETVFVDPAGAHAPVLILPGDRVHVVTTGVDPTTGLPATEDKRIVVDDIHAWTSYDNDTVAGTVPPNASVTVTVAGGTGNLRVPHAGTNVTFAELTAGGDGRFSVGQFRNSGDPNLRTVNLAQGSTGYVRVRHTDGNEVYTVHGQNILALTNSNVAPRLRVSPAVLPARPRRPGNGKPPDAVCRGDPARRSGRGKRHQDH